MKLKKGIRIIGIILLIIGISIFFISKLYVCAGCTKQYNNLIDDLIIGGFILGIIGLILFIISFILKNEKNFD